ncbi:MAG: ATP-dependent helicase, partial [Proteobacteria bacterium]|nr:ATP-dependent helicase [Pseudomonadota bacterium]
AIEKLLKQKIPKEEVSGYTMGGIVPDFVLLRPNNPVSEKKADKGIKELVEKRKVKKQKAKPPAEKTTLKPRTGRKTEKAGGKNPRARTHFQQSSKKGSPRGKK